MAVNGWIAGDLMAPPPVPVHALLPCTCHLTPKVRGFIDHAVACMAEADQ